MYGIEGPHPRGLNKNMQVYNVSRDNMHCELQGDSGTLRLPVWIDVKFDVRGRAKMALEAGEMAVTVEFAKDLKDKDFFGKQDPYCIVKVGTQQYRTRTATDGGKRPVWNETFRFNVLNENDAELVIKDEDVGHDDNLGSARVSFARAREYGRDQVQAPVYTKHGKQHGFVHVTLNFTRNSALKAHGAYPAAYPTQQYAQYPYPQQVPGKCTHVANQATVRRSQATVWRSQATAPHRLRMVPRCLHTELSHLRTELSHLRTAHLRLRTAHLRLRTELQGYPHQGQYGAPPPAQGAPAAYGVPPQATYPGYPPK
ncbi:hypothetical protein VOLCADRAFT_97168 [Volvox carteri f. nagariensis]|uniref:C2 domain-containing protein n=1 Tax=Volvox carteri f. nagariensis TaxID=3068 RepID=D8UC21_VOLCA|nr:uncharacterized protein VOLCADRAFT_97168 [Volvox carteri f. nagariensis]EFJ42719.1 hypothetical protein VOLCADRAFT_97168 [Volvox carteri f. nagariensis]|eukprot:XP_002956180.1 hypothetical protein VOLCADRAFT_97168 [Volvox carteri f. nagariensis]